MTFIVFRFLSERQSRLSIFEPPSADYFGVSFTIDPLQTPPSSGQPLFAQ
jgi:hypothetical protein